MSMLGDGNKENWEDEDRRNKSKSKSRRGKHNGENNRSETAMVRTYVDRKTEED